MVTWWYTLINSQTKHPGYEWGLSQENYTWGCKSAILKNRYPRFLNSQNWVKWKQQQSFICPKTHNVYHCSFIQILTSSFFRCSIRKINLWRHLAILLSFLFTNFRKILMISNVSDERLHVKRFWFACGVWLPDWMIFSPFLPSSIFLLLLCEIGWQRSLDGYILQNIFALLFWKFKQQQRRYLIIL